MVKGITTGEKSCHEQDDSYRECDLVMRSVHVTIKPIIEGHLLSLLRISGLSGGPAVRGQQKANWKKTLILHEFAT